MRVFLLLACLMFVHSSQAQIQKGKWMLGGELDFSSQSSTAQQATFIDDRENRTLQLSPGAGYFFIDKLAGGIKLSFISIKGENRLQTMNMIPNWHSVSNYSLQSNNFGVSPFLRYYFLPVSNRINVFADASYDYARGKTRVESYTYEGPVGGSVSAQSSVSTSKNTAHGFTFSAGPAIFVNSKISFELSIGYSRSNMETVFYAKDKQETILIGTGFRFHFGK